MENSSYNMLSFVGCVGVLLLISTQGCAEQHTVGGEQGWETSTDFDTWASHQTFKVGDTLVFRYSGTHTVVELGSEREYKTCKVGSDTMRMTDGKTVVELTKEGTRYFACATGGHCAQGMKVKITTVAATSDASLPPSSSSTTPASASTSASSYVSGSFAFATIFLVLNSLMIILS